MKFSRGLALGGVGLSLLFACFAGACSSSSASNNATDSGAAASADASEDQVGITAPASTGSATTTTPAQNFALHTLQLGDTDRSGNSSLTAWENYGFNIDGKITNSQSTDVCTLYTGAQSSVQQDGAMGIDNSFGSNILPLVLSVGGSSLDETLNNSINGGAFTVMFDIEGLSSGTSGTATSQTNTGLTGQLFAGGKFVSADGGAAMPTWTTADNWPVVGSLLNNPTSVASGSMIQFPDSYIVNGTWVSGSPIATLSLTLSVSGQNLTLNVHQATVTMTRMSGTHMANGTIAGVITTTELLASLMQIAGHLSTSLCSGDAFNSIATQIEQDSDIIHDGTNVPGTACDAISIGLGFTADEIGVPEKVAVPGTPTPNPCGDAG
jgi:hypothetical protein